MQHFNSIPFRVWNSSAGIPSPPLALFIVLLPKTHLTSCYRMSGSRWVTTSLWLTGFFCVFCRLFFMSSASVRFLLFLSFIGSLFVWNIPLVLEEICSLSHSIVFLYFFALVTYKGLLISPCCSLELCIQLGISFPSSFAFHFSSFLSYLLGLLRQPLCLLAFLFLGDGFGHFGERDDSPFQYSCLENSVDTGA